MRGPLLLFLFFISCAFTLTDDSTVECVKIASSAVRKDTVNHTLFFISGMNIDMDGSPHAYHPDPDSGLDLLANAGHKGNWWGIVTENGKPAVQGKDDPAPGYYVSCTSLQDRTKKISDPLRYVNAETIPYFVLPNNRTLLAEVKCGDVAYVKNLRNGKFRFAIFADVGPAEKIGEGSMYLAEQLGIDASRHGGVRDSVLYVVFPNSGNGNPLTVEEIDSVGNARFKEEMVNPALR